MKQSSWSTFWRIIAPLQRHKKTAFMLLLISIRWAIVPNFTTIVVQRGIDALTNHDERVFLICTWLLGLLYVIWFCIQYPSRIVRWIGMDKVYQDAYDKLLTYYTKMDNNAIEWYGTWKVGSIIQWWIREHLNIIIMILTWRAKVILQFVIATWLVIYYLGWIAGGIMVISLTIILIIGVKSNKWLANIRKSRREQTIALDSLSIKHIMSKFEILQNDKAQREADKRNGFWQKKFFFYRKEAQRMILVWEGQRFALDILRIIAFVYAWYSVLHGDMTIWFFSAVWMLTNSVTQGLFDITETLLQYNQSIIYVDRLWEFVDKEKLVRWYDEGWNFVFRKWDITLQHVTYDYGKWEVLRDFSLQLTWGQKTAFVWISWGGKSTIIKLIAGYIHPKSGEVLVDWQPLPNEDNTDYVSLKSYYKHIGYLTQEPNVFDGSIYENLTYALDHEPTEEEVKSAIEWAQCQFIYEFPDGVQTEIGEKGIKLSWGQRQRLAIAKVMLKNPQIILLDEPTSALDSFSEEEVTKAFNNLFEWRTVIIIAHRLQTVKKADRIIVLDHGKIVEDGNHESLVAKGGVYAKMLELQSGF